uniref:Tc1-like transposase DDE domain-containing protein n=1 Tax=Esox lucius TaxID=8010 RepID=A0AAY5KL34_ESOLU
MTKCYILFENHGRLVLRTKEERDHPACYQCAVQKPTSKATINAEQNIQVLEQHMLPSRQCVFQGRPCLFQRDNAKPHSARITTAWLHSKRVWVLNWPACSPDLSPIEIIWCIMKTKNTTKETRNC